MVTASTMNRIQKLFEDRSGLFGEITVCGKGPSPWRHCITDGSKAGERNIGTKETVFLAEESLIADMLEWLRNNRDENDQHRMYEDFR